MFKECEECGHHESTNSCHISKTACGAWICSSCLEAENFFFCEECKEWNHIDEKSSGEVEGGDPVCNDCYAKLPSSASNIMALTREFNQSRGI